MTSHFDEIAAAYQGDDAELRQMLEQRAVMVDLHQHPGWEAYRDFVYSRIAVINERILLGRMKTLEEYKEQSGLCRGLREAVDSTLERMESSIAVRIEALTLAREDEEDVDSLPPE